MYVTLALKHVFLNLVGKYVRLKWKKKCYCNYCNRICLNMSEWTNMNRILNMPWVLKMPEYAFTGSEYIFSSTCKYSRVLKILELHMVLNIPQRGEICLNRIWICLNMSEFTIIDRVLNMHDTVHSARSLYKLNSTCWEIGVFRTPSNI